mmetsp:Transcript_57958/g.118602  ORF Transcript_57958/g.118602 Transcript_57958/m.118602 type:complete len:237 (+) Transcript_57958:1093-1803(+)
MPGRTPMAIISMSFGGGRKITARSGRFHGVSMDGIREKTAAPASSLRFSTESMSSGGLKGRPSEEAARIDNSSFAVASRSIAKSASEKLSPSRSPPPVKASMVGRLNCQGMPPSLDNGVPLHSASAPLGDNPFDWMVLTRPWKARRASTFALKAPMLWATVLFGLCCGCPEDEDASPCCSTSLCWEDKRRSTKAAAGQDAAGTVTCSSSATSAEVGRSRHSPPWFCISNPDEFGFL